MLKTVLVSALTAALVCSCLLVLRSADAARNASGTFSLYTPGNPVVTATTISSSWANNTLADIKTEITDSLSRSGKGAMLQPLQLYDGAVNLPGLTFGTETGTGLYRIGANDIGFSVAGVKKLELTSSLFTVTPALTVTGAAAFNGTLTANAAGQSVAAFDTAGALGGSILLKDSGGIAGNGGAVIFAAAQGSYAAIKGLAVNGSNNTTGDIVVATRRLIADSTLTESVRFPVAGGIIISNSVGNNGSGFKHIRAAGCTTAAVAGATCSTTLTFTNAFADANYTVVCSGETTSSGVPVLGNTITLAGSVATATVAVTAAAAAFARIHCIAVHD